MSLQRHIHPNIWKSTTVMPIFKKGDKSEISNYRPISLINCVGKFIRTSRVQTRA